MPMRLTVKILGYHDSSCKAFVDTVPWVGWIRARGGPNKARNVGGMRVLRRMPR